MEDKLATLQPHHDWNMDNGGGVVTQKMDTC